MNSNAGSVVHLSYKITALVCTVTSVVQLNTTQRWAIHNSVLLKFDELLRSYFIHEEI